jgi:hypothetical protein
MSRDVTGGSLDLNDTCVDDADTPRPAQANDRPLLNHDVCLPSDNNTDGYNQDPTKVMQFLEHDGTPLVSHRLATTEHTSSKRMQTLQGGRASKLTRLEPGDTAGGDWGVADSRVSVDPKGPGA